MACSYVIVDGGRDRSGVSTVTGSLVAAASAGSGSAGSASSVAGCGGGAGGGLALPHAAARAAAKAAQSHVVRTDTQATPEERYGISFTSAPCIMR
jgi:hypothetical protein